MGVRIEMNTGGLFSGSTVLDFQSDLDTYLSRADDVILSFKTIQSSTYDLNGGLGNLQGAADCIAARISKEEATVAEAQGIKSKYNDFLELTRRVDKQVAADVNKNKDELYRTNPWCRPAVPEEEKPWYEKAWGWICDRGEDVANGVEAAWSWTKDKLSDAWDWTKDKLSDAWEWTKDTAVKIWNGAVEFYNEHKQLCQILIGVAAIAIGVIVTVATGGAALPALLAMTKAAVVAGLTSAAIGGSLSAVFALVRGESLEDALSAGLKSAFEGFCSGFMWGGIFAAGAQIVQSLTLPKAPDNLATARSKGVADAKKTELDAIKNNTSNYDWTPQQKAEFLRNNKITGQEGCHILDASRYPRFASDPNNIILLPHSTHFNIVHGGSWTNPSNWEAIVTSMPQFASQVSRMQRLAVYSDIITSQALPVISSTVVNIVNWIKGN